MARTAGLLIIAFTIIKASFSGGVLHAQTDSLSADTLLLAEDDPIMEMLDSMWQMKLYDFEGFETNRDVLNIYAFDHDSTPFYHDSVYAMRFSMMDAQSPFAFRYNNSVKRLTQLYTNRRKKYAARLLGLAQTYFPLFEQTLEKYGLPHELKCLAIVESGLRADAKSHAGAVGLWQFMLPTAKWMGLEVNNYIDERRDPIKATDAACRYLKYLHSLYDDWDLALAAYNAGPGNVNKAIRRAGGGKLSYWEVQPYLPKETQNYVPAFYAVCYMTTYPIEHNIFPVYPRIRYVEYDTVHLNQQVTFEQIQAVLCIDMELLEYLNPVYKTHLIPQPVTGMDRVLTLPRHKIGLFIMNEDYIYAYKREEMPEEVAIPEKKKVIHVVQEGEYLAKIGRQYGVSAGQISTWNSLRSNKVVPGQKLVIYAPVTPPDPEPFPESTPPSCNPGNVFPVVYENGGVENTLTESCY